MIKKLIICLGLLTWIVAGCSPTHQAGSSSDPPGTMTGTVRFINLEGGFFGIIADDERQFDPVNLPEDYRQDGLRIKFTGQPDPNAASIHMWGILIRLDTINKID